MKIYQFLIKLLKMKTKQQKMFNAWLIINTKISNKTFKIGGGKMFCYSEASISISSKRYAEAAVNTRQQNYF